MFKIYIAENMKRNKFFMLAIALMSVVMVSSCEKIRELDRQEAARKLKNLQDWVVNGDTSEEAISQFGYENCFKTLALDQEKWDNYMYFYQGDKSTLNRSDYSCVRSLFYDEYSTEHIHVGEIVCNREIAADLLAIFRQLYEAKYHISVFVCFV